MSDKIAKTIPSLKESSGCDKCSVDYTGGYWDYGFTLYGKGVLRAGAGSELVGEFGQCTRNGGCAWDLKKPKATYNVKWEVEASISVGGKGELKGGYVYYAK